MTRYTVTWTKSALDGLAALWLGAIDRMAVTLAAASIDRALASDPMTKVKPLSEGLWFFDDLPLRAICIIRPADRIVEVVGLSIVRGSNGEHPRKH